MTSAPVYRIAETDAPHENLRATIHFRIAIGKPGKSRRNATGPRAAPVAEYR
jgi:hypothetical protein